ncbi:MAG: hypothetical protein IPP71_20355 [Bacteroidetes bacterium]|nr:hypothetical protein [Bacteroidota bacterium]
MDANAAPDGFASVSPTGGTPPYYLPMVKWETSDLNFNLLPGSYTITVTDANLCTATDVAVIFNALGPCAIIVDSILVPVVPDF